MKSQIVFFKIILFLIIISSVTIVNADEKAYSIKIKVSGIKEKYCQLGYYFGDKQYLKDSAKADAQGKFLFEGKEKLEGGIYLVILPDKSYFELVINDKEQNFSVETDTSDLVKKMKVKGSTENELFYDYLNYINPRGRDADLLSKTLSKTKNNADSTKMLKEKISVIDKEVVKYKEDFMKNHPATFTAKIFKAMNDVDVPEPPVLSNGRPDSTFRYRFYKAHYWDNIDFSDGNIVRTPIFHRKLKQYFETMVLQIPDSINKDAYDLIEKAKKNKDLFKYIVFYITNTYERSNIMGMDAVFVFMTENYYKTKQAFWVDSVQLKKIIDRSNLLKPILIGKPAPNMLLQDTAQKNIMLYAVQAKYTILAFWDPDCGHCKKEIPKLAEIHKKYKSNNIQTYAVCIERDSIKGEKAWKKFIRDNKLDWINVNDHFYHTDFKQLYDVYSTPVLYLLDDEKKIMMKRIGVEQVEDFMERTFKPEKKEEIKNTKEKKK